MCEINFLIVIPIVTCFWYNQALVNSANATTFTNNMNWVDSLFNFEYRNSIDCD